MAGAAVAVVVFVVRLAASWGRHEYSLWPDEPAQLAIARWVGGGERWYMHNHSIWRPMFGTLLSPVYWFTDDPTSVFHVALVLNAALGGVAAWLLVLFARRLTPMSPTWCAVAAGLVALSPAMLFTTDFVFSESLVVPLYLATLWFLLRLQQSPNLIDGLLAGIFAALAFGTHSRMLPLTIVLVAIVVLAAVRRRMAVLDATATVVVAVAGVFAMSVYTSYLVDRLWNEPSTRNSASGVLEQLTNGPTVLVSLVGQTWTLLVGSLGVAAYGAVALARAAIVRRQDGGTRSLPAVGDSRVVLVVFGACAALSVVFMSDRWRSDQLVYGRYNAAVVSPLLLVGIAALVGSVRLPRPPIAVVATAGTTVVCGAVLWTMRRELLLESNGLEPMILALQPFIVSETSLDVPTITMWATLATLVVGAAAVLVRERRARSVTVVTLLAVAVVAGSLRTRDVVDRLWDDSGDASAVAVLRQYQLDDGVPVDYFLPAGSNSTIAMMLYQYHLPRTPFSVVTAPTDGADGTFVFAPSDDAALAESGAEPVWTDPRRPISLWER